VEATVWSFVADTDSLRRHPSIAIATATSNNGLNVVVATPQQSDAAFQFPNRFAI
jgi:hypothetical protein